MGCGKTGVDAPRIAALAMLALAAAVPAFAGDASQGDPASAVALAGGGPSGPLDVQTIVFPGRRFAPVQVVRGPPPPRRPAPRHIAQPRRVLPAGAPAQAISTQIVSFGDGTATRVTVIRGAGFMPVSLVRRLDPLAQPRVETVSFADPLQPAVRIVRGPGSRDLFSVDLFGPADGGELERIAFAVDGAESRHGQDLRMWRPELDGPQGPMQVSAAAAFDVGGGDRFDLRQNRLLGRAYLAQMFRRYGNWVDAVAAYNWGPGNVDQWIAGGRSLNQLPFGVARYITIVLRNALITTAVR